MSEHLPLTLCQASAIPTSSLSHYRAPSSTCIWSFLGSLPYRLQTSKIQISIFPSLKSKKKKAIPVLWACGLQQPILLPTTGEALQSITGNTRGSLLPVNMYLRCDSAPVQRKVNASKGKWRRSCSKRGNAVCRRVRRAPESSFQEDSPLQQEQKQHRAITRLTWLARFCPDHLSVFQTISRCGSQDHF